MQNRKKGLIFVTLAPALWGCSGTLFQFLFSKGITPEWLVSVRLLFAGSFILTYCFLTKKKDTFAVWKEKRSIPQLLFFSIFGTLAIQLSYVMSVSHSNSSMATILQFTNAVMISLVMAVRWRTWPRRVESISLVMAVFGVVLLVTDGQFTELKISSLGLFWGILSAVASVIYTLMPAKLISRFGSIPIVGWAMFISGVLFNLYSPMWRNAPKLDIFILLLLLVVIIFGTMIPFILFLQGLSYVKPTTASMLGAVEPLTATLLTVTFLGTKIGLPQIIGMLLVLSTVFIQSLDQPHILSKRKGSQP